MSFASNSSGRMETRTALLASGKTFSQFTKRSFHCALPLTLPFWGYFRKRRKRYHLSFPSHRFSGTKGFILVSVYPTLFKRVRQASASSESDLLWPWPAYRERAASRLLPKIPPAVLSTLSETVSRCRKAFLQPFPMVWPADGYLTGTQGYTSGKNVLIRKFWMEHAVHVSQKVVEQAFRK